MANLKDNNLEIIFEAGNKNLITWKGKSDARDPSSILNPYFDEMLSQLLNKELEVNFTHLEYMNSSTVPPIIQLIKKLEENAIKSVILYDKNSKWQLASFKALETIVRTMNNIEVRGV